MILQFRQIQLYPHSVYMEANQVYLKILKIKLAIYIDELPETVTHIHKKDAITFYNNFIAKDTKKI